MAILGISIEAARRLKPAEIQAAFEKYARYIPDSPRLCYAIRVGSRTLHSDDTLALRLQFGRRISELKRTKK